MKSKTQQGSMAETLACRYLEAQGLNLIKQNYRCRLGEVDLIMQDGQHLVFVEVRSRSDHRFGTPAETVSKIKQRRLIRTASYYLQRHSIHMPCRFDIIAITLKDQRYIVEWIKNAFQSV